jgi:hypothetical protein
MHLPMWIWKTKRHIGTFDGESFVSLKDQPRSPCVWGLRTVKPIWSIIGSLSIRTLRHGTLLRLSSSRISFANQSRKDIGGFLNTPVLSVVPPLAPSCSYIKPYPRSRTSTRVRGPNRVVEKNDALGQLAQKHVFRTSRLGSGI